MKIFNEPWMTIFDWLPAWSRLSRKTREFFVMEIPNDLHVSTRIFDPACVAELRSAGFITGEAPRLPPDIRPFRRAIRAMHRHRVFDGSVAGMRGYLEDHLTNNEAMSLLDHPSYYGNYWHQVASRVSDEAWIKSFLDAPMGAKWEQAHINQAQDTWLRRTAAVEQLKRWLRQFIEGENPVLLASLLSDCDEYPGTASDALTAGIRYLLLFPALTSDTLDPVIGIWPTIHQRMNRVTAKAPTVFTEPPAGAAVFGEPFLLHDMTMVLVNSFPDGLRLLRSGGGLYKRELDRLVTMLTPLPENLDLNTDGAARVCEAYRWLEAMGLTGVKGKKGKQPSLAPTENGRAWLALTVSDRLRSLIEALRKAYDQRGDRYVGWGSHICLVSRELNTGGWGYDKDIDPQRHLVQSFGVCSAGGWICRKAFLDWQAETENPILRYSGRRFAAYTGVFHAGAPEKEAVWRAYVTDFVRERLIPLGCAQACADDCGNLWFSITSTGAYLLGLSGLFEFNAPETTGQVLVQPNFEVVFTGAAPGIESEFAHMAERIGQGVGTLFRITRKSVLTALDAGIETDDVLKRLNDLTHKPLPANVVSQIQDWAGSYRRVAVRRMVTIRCPDAETALHVQAIFPRLMRPLTETLLELVNSKSLPDVTKKLKKNGIGVE